MEKPYLVYMSSSNDVWVSDAYAWMKTNGKTESDFKDVISEHVWHVFQSDGRINGHPCVFVWNRQPNNDYRNK